ncbi:AraC family transcriptional regulator [Marinagarivorans cellulosilyticus]|uniref:AraC family transcriptional regulator, ethanolamine operon transcriptional activator n=1 Tax=Marinagarivorans cellulosilyticus TaxID=2721545 RepID=A0AAN2BK00_9GAMM|nr:AraC family transcriptional regulator [Marinagarivorans cellulosilyticus]BCD97474.1 AraC family transcriptional regulator, ethanolamine operon transcriptional activator [Marinagarivorans cellulosilyticus]
MLDISTPLKRDIKSPANALKRSKRLVIPTLGLSLKRFSVFPRYCHIQHTQLSPGKFCGDRTLLAANGVSGLKSTANLSYMLQVSILCPQKFIFGFVAPQGTLFLNGRKITEHDIFVLKADALYDMVVAPNTTLFAFSIEDIDNTNHEDQKTKNSLINTLKQRLISPSSDSQQPFLTLTRNDLRDTLIKQFDSSTTAQPLSVFELSAQLLNSSNASLYRPNSRNNLLLRTLRLMQAQPFAFRKISDVAQACHVSQRGLEKAFDDVLNGSPGEYLKAIQLNRYRSAIIQNADNLKLSLADIAGQLGAVNYSRLSKDYKSFFEQLPSNTRRRLE